ncbi:hypothetical protein P280DRAFT_246847 [Massarina eburnea CBS 473.64]|uniref:Uncharacterized protein n=1 Tax=Massarina eburnea CBS 473.64 TaxID=1395130 RepID=A0A6A6S5Q7_9PLEO|nr:hypothetical protein P280DRAFT_246847 [Massarina eburnea CBS 473.64]
MASRLSSAAKRTSPIPHPSLSGPPSTRQHSLGHSATERRRADVKTDPGTTPRRQTAATTQVSTPTITGRPHLRRQSPPLALKHHGHTPLGSSSPCVRRASALVDRCLRSASAPVALHHLEAEPSGTFQPRRAASSLRVRASSLSSASRSASRSIVAFCSAPLPLPLLPLLPLLPIDSFSTCHCCLLSAAAPSCSTVQSHPFALIS